MNSDITKKIGFGELRIFFAHRETRILGGMFLALAVLDVCKKAAIIKVNEHYVAQLQNKIIGDLTNQFESNRFVSKKILENKTYSLSKAFDEAAALVEDVSGVVLDSLFYTSSTIVTGYLLNNIFGEMVFTTSVGLLGAFVAMSAKIVGTSALNYFEFFKKWQDMQTDINKVRENFHNLADAAFNDPIKFEQASVANAYFEHLSFARTALLNALSGFSKISLGSRVGVFILGVYSLITSIVQIALGVKLGVSPSFEYSLVSLIGTQALNCSISNIGVFTRIGRLIRVYSTYPNFCSFYYPEPIKNDFEQRYKFSNTASSSLIALESDFKNRVVVEGKVTERVFASVSKRIPFEQGRIYAVIGASGVGKTTFTYALGNFSPTWAGAITANPLLKDKSTLQYCSQDGMTVLYNVPLFQILTSQMKVKPDVKKVEAVLRELDLWEKFGKDGRVNQPISNPSGGEQARLLLAKAMLQEAKLIILDETLDKTSDVVFDGQDQSSRQKYREVVKAYAKQNGAAVICIQQDSETNWADHVVTFAKQEGSDEPAIISLAR